MQKTKATDIPTSAIVDLSAATGPVTIKMTNDYLFRALLQRNNRVLKGLIRSLLHLSPEEITSVEIANAIELGTSVEEKEFILDIKVKLNSNVIINLEMQVINEQNWVNRSTCYLCRTYSSLNHGDDYNTVKPVIQIGLLDFTLFPERPEFYATYKLINEKSFSVYSDKLQLSVVDLTHIELATEEDRLYRIDLWASFFKATTWEELKMLAHNNNDIQEAVATVYQLTQEEKIRQQCEAREDYYRRQNDIQRLIKKQEETIKEQGDAIRERDDTIREQGDTIRQLCDTIEELKQSVSQQEELIDELRKLIGQAQS